MTKRQKMPDWFEGIAAEFLKPPYFLQAQFEAKSNGSNTATAQATQDAPARSFEPRSGYGQREPSTDSLRHASGDGISNDDDTPATVRQSRPAVRQVRPPATRSGRTATASGTSYPVVPATVLERYPIDVNHREQLPDILRVVTDDEQRYAVKRTTISLPRVWFIHKMLRYAQKQGFTRYSKLLLTKKKSPGVVYDGNVYYATEWIDGQPANFASAEHVAQTAYALAQFHEATRGFTSEKFVPEDAFNLLELTQQRNRDLRQLLYRAEAKKDKDEFDQLFVSLKSALQDDAAESLQLLQQGECVAFLSHDKTNPGIGHLDVIPGNCLYAPDHNVHLIDFELSTFAPRVLDMGHLLRRSLQTNHWSGDIAYACFLHFDTVKSIPKVEYRLVEALLKFPYRAWRLAHTRYHFFKDPAQVDDLLAYADQEARRQSFLKSFTDQVRSLSTGDD
ncbi:phosphotransferase [Alicyclobacillus fastidiosus]|uniref:Phosphotransferase n=1 Tax=Alicyclobacillus fastidiosus TaxID=392011 RepID=A0ABV5AKW0_9BACL|nr:phosphotransferase [Alicyclobacillus fastidiosus]WEH09331.1 phosphotransferase [Alicyclobacillus fastidiosus]